MGSVLELGFGFGDKVLNWKGGEFQPGEIGCQRRLMKTMSSVIAMQVNLV